MQADWRVARNAFNEKTNQKTKKTGLITDSVEMKIWVSLLTWWYYTGAPVVGTPIVGTHYIVSCDAGVCGAERESSRTIQGRMHWAVYFALLYFASGATLS